MLEHLKSRVSPPQTPPSNSAVVQTEVGEGVKSQNITAVESTESILRRRTAELERQLEEERNRLHQLEERNRIWQESTALQHRVCFLATET